MPIILSCVLIFFAIKEFNKCKLNSLSFYLYILYALSFISSKILDLFLEQNVLPIPSIYLLVILLIWIVPFNKVTLIKAAIDGAGKKEIQLGIILCIILIPGTIFYTGELIHLVETTGFSYNIRGDLETQYTTKIGGFIQTMTNFFFVAEFLFFLGFVKKWNKCLIALLFFASLSFPISVLSIYGRDGVIFWFFNFLIFYNLFKPYYTSKTKFFFRAITVLLLASIFLVLMKISIVRFDVVGMGDDYLISGTLGYFGQQLGNFSDIFYFDPEYSGTMIPGFKAYYYKIFVLTPPLSTSDLLDKAGLFEETNVFSTFVNTLLYSYGYIGTIIFSLMIAFIIKFLNQRFRKTASLYYFILIYIIFQIPLLGVFYYRQGLSRGDIAYFIGIVVMFVIYRLTLPKISTPKRMQGILHSRRNVTMRQ
jgi:oligosaccharide repeat unit polymerase